MEFKEFNEKMTKALDKLKIDYNNNKVEKLWIYMDFLIKENKKYNLTNITEESEIITKHFLDSLAPLSQLRRDIFNKVLDIGTGAGFPGMVWKIFIPEKSFLLVDSTLKKVKFLKLLSAKLEIYDNLEIKHARAEKLGEDLKYRGKYDLVLSRAVAPLNVLAEYTVPFASNDSLLIYYKGPDYEKEIKKSKKAFNLLKAEYQDKLELNIPGLDAERYLIIYKKINNTPKKYPRRNGIPKKRPL